MRIGFDARLYAQTGVGRYIANVLRELMDIDEKNEYFIFLNDPDYDTVQVPKARWTKVRVNIPWHSIVEQVKYPSILHSYNLDVVHFPYFSVPIFLHKAIPSDGT